MAIMRINIAGHEYEVACDDGQEIPLKGLARQFDQRVRVLAERGKRPGDAQLFLIASLMLTDELQDAKRELEQLRHDVQHSSQSFEKNKQIELEGAVTSTIHHIAERIEAIAAELENS
jgi:cell division protein ZapA